MAKKQVEEGILDKAPAVQLEEKQPVEPTVQADESLTMIEVIWGYAGEPSHERLIPAGVYPIDDDRLFGLAEYLITNGHARLA